MNATVASTSHFPEVIQVIFASFTERSKRRIELEDVLQWIAAPISAANTDAASGDEADWNTDEGQTDEVLHFVRKIHDRKRMDRNTYYLVDWKPTWEPREHVIQTAIAMFERNAVRSSARPTSSTRLLRTTHSIN
uniref:Chromo domain-containing protein n=1 Tax=Phytophthora ramorum TaxID=164328 RepID=H3GF35_PHYRM